MSALINEMTGSLRLAILSALLFYVPSLLAMAATDFDAARTEALTSPRAAEPARQPPPGQRERLLGGVAGSYGTMPSMGT